MGFFNSISSGDENMGDNQPDYQAIDDFVYFQNITGLQDMGFEGGLYTWCNDHLMNSHKGKN